MARIGSDQFVERFVARRPFRHGIRPRHGRVVDMEPNHLSAHIGRRNSCDPPFQSRQPSAVAIISLRREIARQHVIHSQAPVESALPQPCEHFVVRTLRVAPDILEHIVPDPGESFRNLRIAPGRIERPPQPQTVERPALPIRQRTVPAADAIGRRTAICLCSPFGRKHDTTGRYSNRLTTAQKFSFTIISGLSSLSVVRKS